MSIRILSSLLVLLPLWAFANTAVVFQRDTINIIPKAAPPQVIEENAEESEEALEDLLPARGALEIDVEIRPQDALRLEWIHTLNTLTETNGVMIVLEDAIPIPLASLQVFTPVDVVVIDGQGLVSQLIPKVVLATLSQEIIAKRPTKAFLYLKEGAIEENQLEPGDRVEHPHFSPEQTVLQ